MDIKDIEVLETQDDAETTNKETRFFKYIINKQKYKQKFKELHKLYFYDKICKHDCLIKGINTFSIGKNIKLATYISRCIDNEILMYLRKNKKIRQEVSIDQALSYDGDGNELHLEDIIGTDKDLVSKNIEEKNDKSLMIKEILNLKPRDRDIMVLRYGLLGNDEFTQKEVAEKLGISQSYISRIEKKVIKKLKCLVSA